LKIFKLKSRGKNLHMSMTGQSEHVIDRNARRYFGEQPIILTVTAS